ncbi:MAG TPA: molybdenum cofactor biosynthesis protein MoaE [Fimbriimonas sp.]|nr:molybdenum cofactor biosynthesis protein MoaE [Fimbriimonas sp.]
MSFSLSPTAIDSPVLGGDLSAGASVSFVGRVRNVNEGRSVTALEYEAFDELAATEGMRIVEEAVRRFSIVHACCRHRVGKLALGEAAIHVEVLSGHRDEAFNACRWIVDEVKARVPIWKKEYYEDGVSEWLVPGG